MWHVSPAAKEMGMKAGDARVQVRREQDVAGSAAVAAPGAAVGRLPPGAEGRAQRTGDAAQQGRESPCRVAIRLLVGLGLVLA